ncbi:helix-turn-helix transcriptional regulator [Undibacterium terreum]|uniref:helix-turn-helix transcriptional regulator n=1 Tax=Undibacterium terreum TaxID=1224302 RepID=UPI001668E136|nr:AlpA family phage regulatory protein [Undibacterium terreum]
MPHQQSIQLWRLPRVIAETGLSKSEIYRRIKAGTFVKPVRLGARAIAFDSSAIQSWVKSVIQGGVQ